jgi:hypothetical protein
VWSSALGFTKTHQWCPGPATPDENTANCAGFGNFIFDETLRLSREASSELNNSDSSSEDSSLNDDEKRQRVDPLEESEADPFNETNFRMANMGQILDVRRFGGDKIWYSCDWVGPCVISASKAKRKIPRGHFKPGLRVYLCANTH